MKAFTLRLCVEILSNSWEGIDYTEPGNFRGSDERRRRVPEGVAVRSYGAESCF